MVVLALIVAVARSQVLEDVSEGWKNGEGLRSLGLVGLHVGCGLNLPKHAVNTDINGITAPNGQSTMDQLVRVNRDHYFLQHDALQRYPFADGSFEWIFAEHFLEHIDRTDAVSFLHEARRLLGTNGVIRISTPDLAAYVRGFLDPTRSFLLQHHAAMTTGPMAGKNAHLKPTPAATLNDLFFSYGHRHLYDLDDLISVAYDAKILVPQGDCVAHPTTFNHSAFTSSLLQPSSLDDPVKVHESFYVDFFCSSSRR